jgi:SNF2 family DNA or RNA helicase
MTKISEAVLPYQKEDVQWLVERPRGGLLGHKTGLGKTVIALGAIEEIQATLGRNLQILVVGSKSATATWRRLVRYWLGAEIHLVQKQQYVRKKIWEKRYTDKGMFEFWVTTYESYMRDAKALGPLVSAGWDIVICDEGHKKLKNRKNKTWTSLQACGTRKFWVATATAANRGPQDLWSYLHLFNPHKFSSYWRFVNQFCYVQQGQFGQEVYGVKNLEELKRVIKDYVKVRNYAEVMPQMPEVTRRPVVIDMDEEGEQAKMFYTLNSSMIAETSEGGLIVSQNVLVKVLRLRQINIAPQMLDPNGPRGAMIDYLVEAIEGGERHCVVFTPFAQAIQWIKKALLEEGLYTDQEIATMQGGLDADGQERELRKFRESKGVMICSVGYAESFSLDTARLAYFVGFSWDPNENLQCEGRLRRVDTKFEEGAKILCMYLLLNNEVDERVREVIDGKTMTVGQFLQGYRSAVVEKG